MDEETVKVGDVIVFSLELLQQIYEQPQHRSVAVEVKSIAKEVHTEDDGSKVISKVITVKKAW